MEAVSDKNGRIYFPGWAPRFAFTSTSHLVSRDPEILLFKSGYIYLGLANKAKRNYNRTPFRYSEWDGKAIEMKKFDGPLSKYIEHFEEFNQKLDFLGDKAKNCDWKKVPQTLTVVSNQRKIFETTEFITFFSVDEDLISNDSYYLRKGGRKCGSPKEFIQELHR